MPAILTPSPEIITPEIAAIAAAALGGALPSGAAGPARPGCDVAIKALADALDEAGCDADTLLDVLRQPHRCRVESYYSAGYDQWQSVKVTLRQIAGVSGEESAILNMARTRAAEIVEARRKAEAEAEAARLCAERRAAQEEYSLRCAAESQRHDAARVRLARISRLVSPVVRDACGQRGTPYPIALTGGAGAPQLTGQSWHYETAGGRRIQYPSAYAKSGWSNMHYVPSSLLVEVGRDWLVARVGEDAVAEYEAAAFNAAPRAVEPMRTVK